MRHNFSAGAVLIIVREILKQKWEDMLNQPEDHVNLFLSRITTMEYFGENFVIFFQDDESSWYLLNIQSNKMEPITDELVLLLHNSRKAYL